MKIPIHDTPDSYKSISCIRELDDDIKVFKNITADREVFYHVAKEPSADEIESPDDIVTLHAFKIGSNETEYEVRREAINTAKTY